MHFGINVHHGQRAVRCSGQEDGRESCPDCRGGVGSAFGGKICGGFWNVDGWSGFGEKGGVCAYLWDDPIGLGSAPRGVENGDLFDEKRLVEDALDWEVGISEVTLWLLRGVCLEVPSDRDFSALC